MITISIRYAFLLSLAKVLSACSLCMHVMSYTMSSFFQHVHRKRGLLYALLCALLVTTTDLFVKLVIDEMSALQLVSIRMTISLMCTIPTLLLMEDGRYLKYDTQNEYKLLIIRSLFATTSTIFIVIAFSYADMGSVIAVINSMPIFAGLISRILLKEKFTKIEVLLSVMSLIGVLLISQPPFIFHRNPGSKDGGHFVGTLFALAGAIVTGASFVLSRILSQRNVRSITNLFHYALIGAVVGIPLNSFIGVWSIPQCGKVRIYLVLIGILNTTQQFLLIKALEIEKAVRVTVTLTLNIFFAFAFQFIFLAEVPGIYSILGSAAIFAASAGIAVQKSRTSRNQEIVGDHDGGSSTGSL